MNRLVFIAIILTVLGTVWWTASCFWKLLPLPAWGKAVATGLYLASFLAIFFHFALGNRMPMWLAVATYEAGTSWMIFYLYSLIAFAVLYLGRVANVIPQGFLHDSPAGTITILAAITALLVYGNLHYHHKYREHIDIATEKPLDKPLTIVLASDIHAGYHNRGPELRRWVNLINAETPDLVLFAGDILDGAIRPVRHWHYEDIFKDIKAPVYSCPGNHEYISGISGAEDFFDKAGIQMLKDSSAVRCGVRIIGRDDRSNPGRRPLRQLIRQDSLFTIVLDHQPYNLKEAERCGIDFQFSGHTHHGQVWPLNHVTDLIFEKAFGRLRKGGTDYYISSGLGIWGGKFRIGTRSEYIVLTVH